MTGNPSYRRQSAKARTNGFARASTGAIPIPVARRSTKVLSMFMFPQAGGAFVPAATAGRSTT